MKPIKRLIVMRGPPGSGKSTLAECLANIQPQKSVVLSTDEYFVGTDGVYRFKPSEIAKAHQWNQERAAGWMADECRLVIIDNTNTAAWQAKPYVLLAQTHGYEVEFVEAGHMATWDAATFAARNVHGCPLETIERMIADYEPDITVESCLAAKAPWER